MNVDVIVSEAGHCKAVAGDNDGGSLNGPEPDDDL